MLGQQIRAQLRRRTGVLDHQVALAVEPHRAAAEVGRADPRPASVHHHYLAVDVDAGIAQLVGDRRDDAQPTAPVMVAQTLQRLVAQHIHGRLLQPSGGLSRQHDNHFRPVGLRQPLAQGAGDGVRRVVLVLDIEGGLRGRDHVEEQLLDFADQPAAVLLHPGARQGDGRIARPYRDVGGPQHLRAAANRSIKRRQCRAGGVLPAERGKVAQVAGRLAGDQRLHIVEGPVAAAGLVDPARIVRRMRPRVPPALGQVEATEVGELPVDDDELLVLARAGRMRAVQLEMQPVLVLPAELRRRQQLALQHIDHREVPGQDVDGQVVPARRQILQRLGQRARVQRVVLVTDQLEPAVDIPTDDQDLPLGSLHALADGAEIRLAVDQPAETLCAGRPPDVFAGREQAGRGVPIGGVVVARHPATISHSRAALRGRDPLPLRHLRHEPGSSRPGPPAHGVCRLPSVWPVVSTTRVLRHPFAAA